MAQAGKDLFQKRKNVLKRGKLFHTRRPYQEKGNLKNLGIEVFFRKLSLRKK
ncbi:hypothetical protein [Methanosarcina barkeri]|uniref:hypothetical protein n=1 Tax=Methanosarcina barkeri TaxID=2208 RepID=UPI000A3EE339|nr:hypothetical protein [Methanosarcina barkeri]